MDVEKFVRHLCRLVLRHQMPVWNYFVNSFYSDLPLYFWQSLSQDPPSMQAELIPCRVPFA
jgi:hypothetical protein